MVKIIFFDIDGTLVDMQAKKISPKTAEALQRLQNRGIRICIATGRPTVCLPKFEGVDFDAFLTFNGSCCYDRSGPIFRNPLLAEDVQKVIRNAAGLGRPVAIATKDTIAANGEEDDLTDYFAIGGRPVPVAEDFAEISREEIYQMMLGCRESDYPAIVKGTQNAQVVGWWGRAADVVPADGGKGTGIRKILEHYNLDKSEAMAFGDGNNDIDMLNAVGTGVAMGNASAQLKAIADAICGPVTEDGIYHYCVEKGLI